MSHPIVSEREIETYERDGVVCLRGAFAPEWLDLVAEGIEKDIAAPGPLHSTSNSHGV